jgi:hypothetical protein
MGGGTNTGVPPLRKKIFLRRDFWSGRPDMARRMLAEVVGWRVEMCSAGRRTRRPRRARSPKPASPVSVSGGLSKDPTERFGGLRDPCFAGRLRKASEGLPDGGGAECLRTPQNRMRLAGGRLLRPRRAHSAKTASPVSVSGGTGAGRPAASRGRRVDWSGRRRGVHWG